MTNPPTLPYTEATGSDLVAQKVTNHASRCGCPTCWGVRTGFDIGYASGMASGVASGRAQAAADILRALDGDREHMSVADAQLVEWAAVIAEGGGEADRAATPMP